MILKEQLCRIHSVTNCAARLASESADWCEVHLGAESDDLRREGL